MNYLTAAIICLVIAVIAFWHIGCEQKLPSSQFGKLGILFNDYQEAISEIGQPTEDVFEIIIPAHKVVLFGSQKAKQEYHNALAKKYGWKPGNVSWENISSTIPEIVGDMFKTKDGKYLVNTLALGHEWQHTISRLDSRMLDPDEYAMLK